MEHLFNLKGKVALVTGASKGIGEAMARALAHWGAQVVVSSRNQEAVDQVAKSIQEAGGQALAVAAHAGKQADLANLVDQTVAHFGGLQILINNAATNPVFGPVRDTDEAAFDKIMGVNLKGPFMLAKLAYPHLAEKGGSIINISSIGGLSPEQGLGIYSVSKAALLSLTKVMAREWGAAGIRANAICPGLIKTKFSEALWSNSKLLQHVTHNLPLPRIGTVEDLMGAAVFLASDAAAYCTGGVYTVDGGYTI